jgi:pimeloyl-ACP methyl ester carboxylesterase
MIRMRCGAARVFLLGAAAHVLSAAGGGQQEPAIQRATIAGGVELHYVERGAGVPVVFVHGSLSDGSYWNPQLDAFAARYRAVAYSRRYNPPNHNRIVPGYSAVLDADDLAALIRRLRLGRVHVVGHSYGALTGLFLAVRHPELVRTLVLAEAPAVSLLAHLPGDQAALGRQTLADIEKRMVEPMRAAFERGDRETGLRTFIDYVLDDPRAWDRMPEAARQETLRGAGEWDAMLPTGELFPVLDPRAVRRITVPVLILSGERSYPFLGLIDQELARLLPNNRRIILPGATHRMWYEQPEICRRLVLDFMGGR